MEKHYNHERKYDCNERSQKFYFGFDWPKDVNKNKIEFTIKTNKSLAENKIKSKIEQLLSKSMETIFMNTENSKMNLHINFFLICHKIRFKKFK